MTQQDPEDRPSLQELAMGHDANTGVACLRCGCRHMLADGTKRYGDKTYRYRKCRHCGKRVVTREEIVREVESRESSPPPGEEDPEDSVYPLSIRLRLA